MSVSCGLQCCQPWNMDASVPATPKDGWLGCLATSTTRVVGGKSRHPPCPDYNKRWGSTLSLTMGEQTFLAPPVGEERLVLVCTDRASRGIDRCAASGGFLPIQGVEWQCIELQRTPP